MLFTDTFSRFGWTNASVIHGLSLLDDHAKQALAKCTTYEDYANMTTKS